MSAPIALWHAEHVYFRRLLELLAKRCPDLRLDLARLAQEHRILARAGDKPEQRYRALRRRISETRAPAPSGA